ncbi:hypothetical protein AX774_g249 [Zancudomyces culisetae]|uniref:Uncharacterized protein n=1 Tax=Zancudomyces culisetae TaxID=1213189 RepID=A0A1R1PZ12_ZANCU|nr:hypothetical protein AX774_g249 [Zancudomyces culisetae]|eukprot:OMH86177.1 hypothetical protein AX774_g249 [Zancudomyces culisetae]
MESRDEFNVNADALQTKGKVSVGQKRGNPCRLYYEIYGKGDTKVVFINGMGTDRQMWEFVVSVFKKTQPEFQMLTFDNRNTGYSDDGSTLKL